MYAFKTGQLDVIHEKSAVRKVTHTEKGYSVALTKVKIYRA